MTANQSRRRTELGDASVCLHETKMLYQYESLDKDVDCTRLLTILSSESQDGPLVCSLSTVKFGGKPQYEALSYMWGSEEEKLSIIVNNAEFPVTRNLYDALHYLRAQRRTLPIWIDAISINQENIAERNRQLRIMHHIYFRAQTVIVWLGRAYEKYEDLMTNIKARQDKPVTSDSPDKLMKNPDSDDADIKSSEELRLVKDLYSDEYWQRLWIIQEIGQADQLLVCFGRTRPMSWDDFIYFIKMHDLGSDGPSRLHQMRAERDKGGYSLQKLLSEHRASKCKEQRDKIYGLIGLAADAHRFPMDYSKTLIQVWNDVMHFTYTGGLLKEAEVIPFGRLVKFLLMGTTTSPLHQVIKLHETDEDIPAVQQHPVAFSLQGQLLGRIVHIGASTEDIVGKLDCVDAWNETIQQIFRADIENANLESRKLIRAILSTSELRKCYSHASTVKWEQRFGTYAHATRNKLSLGFYLENQGHVGEDFSSVATDKQDSHPKLFQLRNLRYEDRTPWRTGIVTPGARLGDLLVWISNVRSAIVARPTIISDNHVILHIIGTAWVTADVCRTQEDLQSRLQWFEHDYDCIDVEMDVATIFVLLQ